MASGVQISGKIKPFTTAVPKYPVFEDVDGQGSWQSVATITDRDAILTSFKKEGMVVYVEAIKCMYLLASDLTTWNFYDASPELADQDTWEVNGATGSDENTGLAGHPLATVEELCRRLNPRGALYVPTSAVTTISVAAGAYGEFILNGRFPSGTSLYGAVVFINFATAHSAPITLSAVVDPNPSTNTRGQVTTVGATAFADPPHGRIKVLTGPAAGAFSYSMGQNAGPKNHFVKEWWNYDTNSLTPPGVGDIVQTETLLTSVTKLQLNLDGPGYWQFNDPAIHNDSQFYGTSAGGTIDIVGAEIYGDTAGGVADLWSTFPVFANCNIVSGDIQISGAGYPAFYGCVVQNGAKLSVYPSGVTGLFQGNAVNGGQLRSVEPAAALYLGNHVEIENGPGGGLAAIDVSEGGTVTQPGGRLWGNSTAYDVGISCNVACWVKISNLINGVPAFNATTQLKLGNESFTFAQIPIVLPDDMCGVLNNANLTAANFSAAPFKATYYVDPGFTGVSTGSSTNPYKTIAAAFAAALTLGITSGIIYLPPNTTITENVTFPVAGGNWEIAGQAQWGYLTTVLNGTVDCTTNATARRALSSIQVTGAITGNANHGGTPSRIRFFNMGAIGNVTLTATGGSSWRAAFAAQGPADNVGLGGFVGGATSIAGSIDSSFYSFTGICTMSANSNFFCTSHNTGFVTNSAGLIFVKFYNVDFSGGVNINATSGSLIAQLDGASAANAQGQNLTVTGAVTVNTIDSNRSARSTIANNVAVANLGTYPQSLARATATLTVLTPGTLGNAQVNVTYTDMTGTLRTKPILSAALDITSAAGTEASGELIFSQNGATTLQYSVTGITTPGALSLSLGVATHQES